MIQSIQSNISFHQSPLITYYQKFLGDGTTPQQAEAFLQGLEQWMNAVFASYASGEKKANDALKQAQQS